VCVGRQSEHTPTGEDVHPDTLGALDPNVLAGGRVFFSEAK
jgi:hypothetical protein